MKKLLFFATAVLYTVHSFSQNSDTITLKKIIACIDTYENRITCKKRATGEITFSKLLTPIYSKIILNNDGIIKNGTAASINYEKDISIGANYQKKISKTQYYKVGFSSGIKDGFQAIYQNNKFKNDFSINFGYTIVRKNATRFFNYETCMKLKNDRKMYETFLLNKYKKILDNDSNRIASTIASLKKELTHDYLSSFQPFENDTTEWKEKKKQLDNLTTLLKDYNDLKNVSNDKDTSKLKNFIENDISKLESNNPNIFNGYKIHWVDIDMSIPFKGYFLYKSAVSDSLSYNLMGKLYINGTYNFVRYTKCTAWYIYGGLQLLLDRGILAVSTSDTITRKFDEKSTKFQDITRNAWYNDWTLGISPNVNCLFLICKDKVLGLDAGLSYKYYFYEKFNNTNNNLIDARLGLVANLKGEKELSKGTVGLYAILRNYNSSMGPVKDNLTIGIRLGIPVNRILTTKE